MIKLTWSATSSEPPGLDLYVCNYSAFDPFTKNLLYRNNGNGTFTRAGGFRRFLMSHLERTTRPALAPA